MPLAVLVLLAGAAAGCGRSPLVKVGAVALADADAVVPPAPGPVVELGPEPDAPLPAVPPGATVVQIAASRDAPYANVRALVKAVQAAGARPVLLVGARGQAMALPSTTAAIPQSILLETEMHGGTARACMAPPEAIERQCAARSGAKHVDRAFVRQIVRDAVKGFALTTVHVKPDPAQSWADAVRAIDGARSCCGKDVVMTLSLEDLEI